ncbi:uncharacterized protein LOC6050421 [Culex quinquefasciatus]|uniref:uncharacterized protein LOC6050421 n=1 Tax=Culex quinquefasciatus TaxID=7176 RepID=UPI0018E335EA|nr:uncharacterized protein LOC6050421 [Culex quinquefasciatus]
MNQLQQQHHHQRRRQSLLNRRVQEEFLIEQVKLHPVLYDKSMKAYRKPGATDSAWSEIAQAFGVKVEDCKKRWKSLRDTFIKYYRQEILAATMPGMKRKKWVYYELMSFLRSHVELYGNEHHFSIADTESISDKETILSEGNRLIQLDDYVTEDGEFLGCSDEVEDQFDENQTEYIYEDVEETSTATVCTIPETHESLEEANSSGNSARIEVIQQKQHHTEQMQDDTVKPVTTVPVVESSQQVVAPSPATVAITDPDERFLLSCAPVLKRLSTQKNALVKLKIQQLLYEVEFGDPFDFKRFTN